MPVPLSHYDLDSDLSDFKIKISKIDSKAKSLKSGAVDIIGRSATCLNNKNEVFQL